MTLGYPSRLNVITKIFISERGDSRVSQRTGMRERKVRDVIAGFENRRGPQIKECGKLLENGKDKETNSLEPLEG